MAKYIDGLDKDTKESRLQTALRGEWTLGDKLTVGKVEVDGNTVAIDLFIDINSATVSSPQIRRISMVFATSMFDSFSPSLLLVSLVETYMRPLTEFGTLRVLELSYPLDKP